MAITRLSKRGKADVFVETAPDGKRDYTLRGKRRPITFTLPPDLITQIDQIAAKEERSRAKMIEIGMRKFVREYQGA